MKIRSSLMFFRNLKIIILLVTTIIIPLKVQNVSAQEGTPPIPTVTGTPLGAYIRVKATGQDQINVRSGPDSTVYPVIGVLLVGQEMPARGITAGGDWVLIQYPGVQGGEGWVYSTYVDLLGGEVPIVQAPATPSPQFTPTIDPTLAARFAFTTEPTRLATFTPAPPIVIPTFEDINPTALIDFGVPMGLIIIILGIVGILLASVAFIQRR